MPAIRPRDGGKPPVPEPITKWRPAPKGFEPDEQAAWKALGRALIPLRTVCRSDLLMVEQAALEMARLARMRRDPGVAETARNATSGIVKALLVELGLSPQARRATTPLAEKKAKTKFDAVDDD